jgi:hypothetical protein
LAAAPSSSVATDASRALKGVKSDSGDANLRPFDHEAAVSPNEMADDVLKNLGEFAFRLARTSTSVLLAKKDPICGRKADLV